MTLANIKFALDIYRGHHYRSLTQQISKKALIIIVDDEVDSLGMFATHLTLDGYNVHAFSDPEIAFEHFKHSPNECSMVISDVRMPKMTGFQLARKVKELNPDVKFILTSTFEINMREFKSVLPNAPIDSFLDKPISFKKLSELARNQLLVA